MAKKDVLGAIVPFYVISTMWKRLYTKKIKGGLLIIWKKKIYLW